jgi:putative phosphoesterase
VKLAIISDVHANQPALRSVLGEIAREGVDTIVHLGDAIAIGPQPRECLETLLALPNARFVIGNHDAWFAYGLPQPQPKWMSDGEVAHQRWTHAQLDAALRETIAAWPIRLALTLGGARVAFVHYALDASGRRLQGVMRDPTVAQLDAAFAVHDPDQQDLVFYGHTHIFSDVQGRARYVNPGSVGCAPQAVARYTLMTCHDDRYELQHRIVAYDDAELFAAFEARDVPERAFIAKAFLGGRYG